MITVSSIPAPAPSSLRVEACYRLFLSQLEASCDSCVEAGRWDLFDRVQAVRSLVEAAVSVHGAGMSSDASSLLAEAAVKWAILTATCTELRSIEVAA